MLVLGLTIHASGADGNLSKARATRTNTAHTTTQKIVSGASDAVSVAYVPAGFSLVENQLVTDPDQPSWSEHLLHYSGDRAAFEVLAIHGYPIDLQSEVAHSP